MPVFNLAAVNPAVSNPESGSAALRRALARPGTLLVACFCAAWCDTCNQYRPRFEGLAQARPQHAYAWIDIEENAELLGDEDVENFPTILVQSEDKVLFFGAMLPHIGHLERLLDSLGNDVATPEPSSMIGGAAASTPDIRALLAQACTQPGTS